MSRDRKALKKVPVNDAEYEVGYGKPPKLTRFRKGQSGNPSVRPKGSKNKPPAGNEERLKDIILQEAYRVIPVRDGEGTVTMPVAQAVIRTMAINAAKRAAWRPEIVRGVARCGRKLKEALERSIARDSH